jgi:hypothetical protein
MINNDDLLPWDPDITARKMWILDDHDRRRWCGPATLFTNSRPEIAALIDKGGDMVHYASLSLA